MNTFYWAFLKSENLLNCKGGFTCGAMNQRNLSQGNVAPPRRLPFRRVGGTPINTDPGVYEPADPYKANFTEYPDQNDFLNQIRNSQQQIDLTYPVQKELINGDMDPVNDTLWEGDVALNGELPPEEPATSGIEDLPLANDYQGIGGPSTVPLSSPGAFQRPEVTPHQVCLLDDLYLAPSPDQIKAYQKVLSKQEIAQTKTRLKWSILFHLLMTLVMLGKLLPEILDRIDVFVLEIEELFLPKPLMWEWTWLLSCPITLMGWSSCNKSNASLMNKFITLLFLLGLTPVLFGMVYYCSDLYAYISTGSKANLAEWQGFPVAGLWYVFFLLTMQAHAFELYFAGVLIKAWMPKKKVE